MLERTQVFVDTSYLLASFYNSWETGARAQLEIDLPEVVNVLGTMIQSQLGQPIQRQMWYDGIPDSGPHRYQRALRTCDGVQLRAGQLIEWGERRTQKAVDTRLVADMVLAGVRGQCSDIVLVSGDADMIPGVQEATAAGVRVHLYGFGWDSMSSALRHACDSTTILDPREDFADCMQLQVLEGPLPPVVRTKPIGDAEPLDDASPTRVDSLAGSADSEDSDEAPAATTPDVCPVTEHPLGALTPEPVTVTDEDGEDAGPITTSTGSIPKQPATPATNAGVAHSDPDTTPADEDAEQEATQQEKEEAAVHPAHVTQKPTPKPSMMAPKRRLNSRYVPVANEVWESAGFQTPFDVGQQYAAWWFDNAATTEQRDNAHLLSGGGLPSEIDKPLLQFACERLHEFTLTENQRVSLRDGFHHGIRAVLLNQRD